MERVTRLVLVALLVLLAPLSTAWAQSSTSCNITQQVVSGGLSVNATVSSLGFGTVTLSGNDQTVSASSGPVLRVIDASGSNSGWNLTFSSTAFSDGTGTIAATNFKFNPTGGSIVTANTSTQTVNGTSGPKETGGGAVALNVSRKVVTTSAGFGKGTYVYTPLPGNFSLTVPGTTVRGTGTFTATMTVTINSGP
jgi:hypothetical protein